MTAGGSSASCSASPPRSWTVWAASLLQWLDACHSEAVSGQLLPVTAPPLSSSLVLIFKKKFSPFKSLTTAGDLANELVRHFLIECTPRGVRLKGCSNEPYFGKWLRARTDTLLVTGVSLALRVVSLTRVYYESPVLIS